ncbi:sugar ABC transporter substrate-binding protein [Nitrincola tibetensis]|uniref:Probable sugar-binding periplasmic protein n=1 Tax=Nitrincola tibetensis TaxID=2219697 RepID=A0A364NJ85_9GAMM|nr:ABC transporter substrate-binding protein [Nitrincola tibetensis]RAU16947.1 sugar ABC transporter substrate-binding protein [Nitrincola tibetensis]
MNFRKSMLTVALTSSVAFTAQAGEVEVLHWWTSGGEAAAVSVLKSMVEKEGHTWKDFAVAGGGGENTMTVLRARAVSGNPPSSAQIKGLEIHEWADLGFLSSLNDVAEAEGWKDFLPEMVSNIMQFDGEFVAVPVNVHRVNWMWANPAAFEKAGVELPTSLDELWAAADKLKAAGIIPIAHGGQAWQDATTFESIALSLGGPEFFVKAFVEHDPAALQSDTMIEAFEQFRKVRDYLDPGFPGREWNIATSMVIRGDAAMQFMGDWAKGEFSAANMQPGTDYLCLPFPGTDDMFTFNIDSLAMFKQRSAENVAAQNTMARLVLSPEFQETFNMNKGSIPVRLDQDMSGFDACAQASMDTFKSTSASGEGLVPSMAHGMSTTSAVQGAIYDVTTTFFNSSMTAQEATRQLASAIRAAQ